MGLAAPHLLPPPAAPVPLLPLFLFVLLPTTTAASRAFKDVSMTTSGAINSDTQIVRKKQLRWYMGNAAEVQDFLVGANSEHFLNFTGNVSDITGGIYQCCNGETILPNGSLSAYNASSPPWNITAFAHLDMYKTLVIYQNCSASGTPAGCWTAGNTCNAALARVDDFTTELVDWLDAYSMKGLNLDWEYGAGCNVTCHMQLWSRVSKTLRAKGKELAISVDDSKGVPFNPLATNWTYETDWEGFVDYADVLINMGTYPGGWAKGISWPAWQYIKPYPCAGNQSRSCGVEGQVLDMIANGADPSYQLQPGIWIDTCFPNGTMTQQGWTEASLLSFLQTLDSSGVNILTIWTGDAFLLQSSRVTCPWFMPAIRKWALDKTDDLLPL